jgi:hypothetical protein
MTYLIPTRLSFGDKPIETKIDQMQDVTVLGFNSFCDIQARNAFMVWQGHWQVTKVDLETKRITRFGKKPKNYIQPNASKDLKHALQAGNFKKYKESCRNMSWMVNVIAWKEYVLTFYVTYEWGFDRWQTYVQMYNGRGDLLLENKLDGLHSVEHSVSLHMNKKNGQLVGLAHFLDDHDDDQYQVLKYEID